MTGPENTGAGRVQWEVGCLCRALGGPDGWGQLGIGTHPPPTPPPHPPTNLDFHPCLADVISSYIVRILAVILTP